MARRSGVPKRVVYDAVHRLVSRVDHPSDRPDALPGLPEPLPHPVVDNHCHLDIARGRRAGAAGRRGPFAGGIGGGDPHRPDRLRPRRGRAGPSRRPRRTSRSWPGVALHPNEAPRLAAEGRLDDALAEIERLARSSDRVRAVGETGLDYFRTGTEGRAAQHESFRAHVELAKDARQDAGHP